jgi:hypothetical protein
MLFVAFIKFKCEINVLNKSYFGKNQNNSFTLLKICYISNAIKTNIYKKWFQLWKN